MNIQFARLFVVELLFGKVKYLPGRTENIVLVFWKPYQSLKNKDLILAPYI